MSRMSDRVTGMKRFNRPKAWSETKDGVARVSALPGKLIVFLLPHLQRQKLWTWGERNLRWA